jgi:hypothetical protein
MPSPADDFVRDLALRQADQARSEFVAILDELDFVKGQLAQVPNHIPI